MASSLSNLVNNLVQAINRTKCKYGHDNKKKNTKRLELNTKIFINTKVFIHTNTWMLGKNLLKLYYLKNKIFTVT